MMRTSLQPLAHLVDAAAEKWLAAESCNAAEQDAIRKEITEAFWIADRDELTFHGQRFLLTVSRRTTNSDAHLDNEAEPPEYDVSVHKIALLS